MKKMKSSQILHNGGLKPCLCFCITAMASLRFRPYKQSITVLDCLKLGRLLVFHSTWIVFFFYFLFWCDSSHCPPAGRAPDQLLLGRQQQPHGAPRPQPAVPGAVPHRHGAVQGPLQAALPLGQRRPLGPSGSALLLSPRPKRGRPH